MTNLEKKLYIVSLCEYNRRSYNNGFINFLGQYESKLYQMGLKFFLRLCYVPNNLHRFKTKGNWQ